jgi:hypothetical protein
VFSVAGIAIQYDSVIDQKRHYGFLRQDESPLIHKIHYPFAFHACLSGLLYHSNLCLSPFDTAF